MIKLIANQNKTWLNIGVCSAILISTYGMPLKSHATKDSGMSGAVSVSTFTVNGKNDNFKIINDILRLLGRSAETTIRYDEEMDCYFFVVKTDDEHFDSDYTALSEIDAYTRDTNYMNKQLIVTLEGSDV